MKIYGIDFTSAPSKQKPITWAECVFKDGVLRVEEVSGWSSFDGFEKFLRSDGPWIAGMDFPFGQPIQLVDDLQWPSRWNEYVRHVASMWKSQKEGKEKFEWIIRDYKKQPKRATDKLAGSIPPMRLDYQPVGKMFFQGAPRLLESGASVLPCRPVSKKNIVVEAYPKLVVQSLLRQESTKYKNDGEKKKKIIRHITSQRLSMYEVKVSLNKDQEVMCVDDPHGDYIDAVLCAVQGAWAYTKREENYGIPKGHELEGWIVDPLLLRETNS